MSLNASSQEVLCRWAEERYNVTGVTKVDFDMRGDLGPGCETCGFGAEPPAVEVCVSVANRNHSYYDEEYTTDLINSIVEVALRGT